jgi:DNA-binding MarR family transcriptional regulator
MDLFSREKFNPHAIAYYRFLALNSAVDLRLKRALLPFGLTHEQLNILYALSKNHPRKMHVNELKEVMLLPNPDMTRMLDRLERKELVRRSLRADNRRMVDVEVTAAGIQVFEDAYEAAKQAVGHFFSEFMDRKDAIGFYHLLNKIRL